METLMAIVCGLFFVVGTYLILSKNVLTIIFGSAILSHGIHLLILTMGGLKTGRPPLLSEPDATFTDSLPQALILTAIVINFGVTALFLVLSYRTYKTFGTDDLEQLSEVRDD